MKKSVKKSSKDKKPVEPRFFGYKVVRVDGKELKSCTPAGLSVRYISDKFVGPRTWGGPMTVFADNEGQGKFLALGFCAKIVPPLKEHDVRVYRCEYIPTKVEHVWRYRDLGLKFKHVSELPEKTVLAKKVKLLKRVI